MPDHVKELLNRAYLEDKPYNDIVLNLKREMRLNGIGAPDETTLVPLNAVDELVRNQRRSKTKEATAFTVADMATILPNAVN